MVGLVGYVIVKRCNIYYYDNLGRAFLKFQVAGCFAFVLVQAVIGIILRPAVLALAMRITVALSLIRTTAVVV
nr:MAG TPA: hypothetical protein [Caudoviricetes sp.]